ncbi:sensor of ECF-type sigma factor [Flavobacterium akiainvivens]|uniref:Sensor of ECF-type sigma factor n=1 Tax=Flavobacterium akiainvivens TaxID=1202724 RepID=A0A0M9VJW8_9FLAO|nr:hypothetical protein [Flavobacterium akiainvivens]KOS08170.1 sensor of ECF-type sigma factor [Flavobacterium akiainvivens]
MKMKLLTPLLLLFSISMLAQKDHKEKWEQIKALKVSFLTTELSLTPQESEKFWPVYNVYEEKQWQIRHDKMRPIIKKIDEVGFDKVNEKDAAAYLEKLQDAEEELLTLRNKLISDLKPIIGSARLLKLKKAEDDFNKKLLEKYKDKDKKKN